MTLAPSAYRTGPFVVLGNEGTLLSCTRFAANAERLQLHALASNVANFLRTLRCLRR